MKVRVAALLVLIAALALTCACAEVKDQALWTPDFNWLVRQLEESSSDPNAFVSLTAEKEDAAVVFKLPAALESIGDEAFEGTAIEKVEIPENVKSIGERAFANIRSLRIVRIPVTTTFIGKAAFTGSDRVTIIGAPGSYARAWAKENGLPFAETAVLYAGAAGVQMSVRATAEPSAVQLKEMNASCDAKQAPQWRKNGELKADQYDLCIANHIPGHSPPAIG